MSGLIEVDKVVDLLLQERANFYALIQQDKSQKANGKMFAHRQAYNALSRIVFEINPDYMKK